MGKMESWNWDWEKSFSFRMVMTWAEQNTFLVILCFAHLQTPLAWCYQNNPPFQLMKITITPTNSTCHHHKTSGSSLKHKASLQIRSNPYSPSSSFTDQTLTLTLSLSVSVPQTLSLFWNPNCFTVGLVGECLRNLTVNFWAQFRWILVYFELSKFFELDYMLITFKLFHSTDSICCWNYTMVCGCFHLKKYANLCG